MFRPSLSPDGERDGAACWTRWCEMQGLLRAILDDDRKQAKTLLKAEPALAFSAFRQAKLYDFHWLYVGDTPLHLASAAYRVEIAKVLLAAGADCNAAGNHRRGRPLHYAADGSPSRPDWDATRQVAMIDLLLQAGADLHAADKNGATALHRAVRTRCAAAVKRLLEAGSDPAAPNASGSTAFHLAVQNTGRGGSGAEQAVEAQRAIIRQFLAAGVSPDLQGGGGKTVRDSARSGWIRELLT